MKVKKKYKKNRILEFLSQIWEKHLIFALGIGADIRPQNQPWKISVNPYHLLRMAVSRGPVPDL